MSTDCSEIKEFHNDYMKGFEIIMDTQTPELHSALTYWKNGIPTQIYLSFY